VCRAARRDCRPTAPRSARLPTTMAMLVKACRNSSGIDARASSTRARNRSRFTGRFLRRRPGRDARPRPPLRATRCRWAESATYAQTSRASIGRTAAWGGTRGGHGGSACLSARPAFRRQRGRQGLFNCDRVVGVHDAEPVRHTEDVAIEGRPGTPRAWPSTTFAVLRPTPGAPRARPCRGHVARRDARRALAPLRRCSETSSGRSRLAARWVRESSGSAFARALASGYFAKSTGVTSFTRRSVHWAERIVATRSSNGVRKSRLRGGVRMLRLEAIKDGGGRC